MGISLRKVSEQTCSNGAMVQLLQRKTGRPDEPFDRSHSAIALRTVDRRGYFLIQQYWKNTIAKEPVPMQQPLTASALPDAYIARMRELLGSEAPQFLASYDEPRTHGLRLNPRKVPPDSPTVSHLRHQFGLTPVAWCPSGYYYDEATRPGKHPYHAAGLYYIQEPSAMSAVELLDPQPGDVVLDLAAAPGGKSTQIAGKLHGHGLLVANEIHPVRAKTLSENIERMGIANAVVISASPDALADRFPHGFDKIMLDAPCSGEGMFRKDPDAIAEWSEAHVAMCAARQRDILGSAIRMLKPGGTLAYSTCTFSREENEDVIEALLASHPQFELVRKERIWPHKQRGEGHFVAVVRSRTDAPQGKLHGPRSRGGQTKSLPRQVSDAWRLFESFVRELGPDCPIPAGEPLLFGEQLYVLPEVSAAGPLRAGDLQGLKVLRPGLHVAAVKKGRVEPAHAWALALQANALPAYRHVDLPGDAPEALAYMRGESLRGIDAANGWTLVTIDGYPLGWGKTSQGELKNHYPKGLRR